VTALEKHRIPNLPAVLNGRFRIESHVTSGGFGALYRAFDQQHEQQVALKVLMLSDAVEHERFLREAKLLAKLQHPAIVSYVDQGSLSDGQPWLAMQWIEGPDLRTRLKQHSLEVDESVRMVELVADALTAVHDAGIVHRDIKPANIILRNNDATQPVLVDFGIARSSDGPDITRPGVMIGTPSYMAPEQVMARPDVDARADLFSLGCVWFESLVGHPPFVAEQVVAVLAKLMLTDAPGVSAERPGIPSGVETLIARLLVRDRGHRIASAESLLAELRHVFGRPSMMPWRKLSTQSVLTRSELVIRTVLVSASPRSSTAATLPTREAQEIPKKMGTLEAIAEAQDVRLFAFADGSWMATSETLGRDARDAARALATVALEAKKLWPTVPIAIATGKAKMEGAHAPIGAVIDRAAHLLTDAPDDRAIRVDEGTAGLCDSFFRIERTGDDGWLRDEQTGTERERTLLGKPTPFVGRTSEFRTILRQIEDALQNPQLTVSTLIGEAGVGKSRFVSELRKQIAVQWPAARVIVARCTAGAQDAALALSASLVRALCSIRADDSQANAQLSAFVKSCVTDDDATLVAEFLAHLTDSQSTDAKSPALLAAQSDPRVMRDQLERSLLAVMRGAAAQTALIVVIEDGQWADTASLRLLDSLWSSMRDQRIAVIVAARPALRERAPDLWKGHGSIELQLSELSRRAAEELTRAALGADTDQAVIDALVARATGNAFWIEELVRAFVEHGTVDALPDSVAAVVTARFERLSDEARRTLRAASIFGRNFSTDGLARLLGTTQLSRVEATLDELEQKEILGRRVNDRSFVFRHTIFRDVAYESLMEEDRALGHLLAGEWLSTRPAVDPLILATHFAKGNNGEKALTPYLHAARRALDGEDFVGCLSHCEAAQRCDQQHTARGEIALLRAEAARWLARHAEFERYAHEAMEALPYRSTRWFDAAALYCIALGVLERGDDLLAIVPTMLEACQQSQERERMLLLARLAIHLCNAGETNAGRPILIELEKAVEHEQPSDPNLRAIIATARAAWAHFDADPVAYLTHVVASVQAFDSAGNRRGATSMRANWGYALLDLGMLEQAEKVLRETIVLASTIRLTPVVGFAQHNLGLVLLWLGRLQEAEELERSALALFEQLGFVRFVGASRMYLAQIVLAAGRVQQAVDLAQQAVDTLGNAPVVLAPALAVLTLALCAANEHEKALVHARQALALLAAGNGVESNEIAIRCAAEHVLTALHKTDEARQMRVLAKDALLKRASHLRDEVARRQFLERIPDHALVARW
jgi:serine/threonine protein kinase/tetratricopeptide (TPR) repeat protein